MQKAKQKPILRGWSHQAMFFISLGACSLLIAKSANTTQYISTIIYSLGLLMMLGVSAFYHRIHWEPRARDLLGRLDHSAIYVMIAGTCTPITLLVLNGESGSTFLISIWSVAAIGILKSIFFPNLPEKLSAVIYLIPGYMVLPYVSELIPKLGMTNISLLIAGGILYTIGAIFYGLKKPGRYAKWFGYHELFHLFVCVAATLHFMIIYSIVG
ncbi:channel protein, hemolysin III family [Bacteriovorax sp. BAL6_X]|uniref:PAQR family membrane homeostasis protein TrhA n=1 Tax=Bacteriovorax sp. BAL6_X TaxID=1201290 RepID=UPI0003868728|nr:hemolysin III family protein [Bacteriovorax sp. BAL6_X]EPZ50139.1 channel protein, hemolysin III family [Bacteriovorax sp. BAL6_X]